LRECAFVLGSKHHHSGGGGGHDKGHGGGGHFNDHNKGKEKHFEFKEKEHKFDKHKKEFKFEKHEEKKENHYKNEFEKEKFKLKEKHEKHFYEKKDEKRHHENEGFFGGLYEVNKFENKWQEREDKFERDVDFMVGDYRGARKAERHVQEDKFNKWENKTIGFTAIDARDEDNFNHHKHTIGIRTQDLNYRENVQYINVYVDNPVVNRVDRFPHDYRYTTMTNEYNPPQNTENILKNLNQDTNHNPNIALSNAHMNNYYEHREQHVTAVKKEDKCECGCFNQ
jgi:hypothetical protein